MIVENERRSASSALEHPDDIRPALTLGGERDLESHLRSLSAMTRAAPSSRAGGSSGSSGFSASGCPAGTSSHVKSSQAFSVMRSSTRRSIGQIASLDHVSRRLHGHPVFIPTTQQGTCQAVHVSLRDEVDAATDFAGKCLRWHPGRSVRKFPRSAFETSLSSEDADEGRARRQTSRRRPTRRRKADRCAG